MIGELIKRMMKALECATKSVYIWDISAQSDKIPAPTSSKGYRWTYFSGSLLLHIRSSMSHDTEMYMISPMDWDSKLLHFAVENRCPFYSSQENNKEQALYLLYPSMCRMIKEEQEGITKAVETWWITRRRKEKQSSRNDERDDAGKKDEKTRDDKV